MQGTLTTITSAGNVSVRAFDRPAKLDDLRTAIGGGYIEFVPSFNELDGKPTQAVCDEEGKLKGLPYNEPATILWAKANGTNVDQIGDALFGDVCLITGDAEFMEAL